MTTAKVLTQEALARFVGGQIQVVSVPQGFTYRIDFSDTFIAEHRLRLGSSWVATKHGNFWVGRKSRNGRIIDLRRCQFEEGVGTDSGTLMVDCTYLKERITFYPPGHQSNIRLEDVRWAEAEPRT